MTWTKGVSRNQTLVTVAAVTVGTSSTRLASVPVKDDKGAYQGMTLQADSANSGTIYIGDATVTTSNGIAIPAGASYTVPVYDPHAVFAVASGSGQILRIAYV